MYAISVFVPFSNRGGESLILTKVLNFPWVPRIGESVFVDLCKDSLKVKSVEYYTSNATMAIVLQDISCSPTSNYDKVLSGMLSTGWDVLSEVEPAIMKA